jgi:hypothetical protein
MKIITAEQRLVFIRQDVARILEQLPEALLETPIEGFENLGLSDININSDEKVKLLETILDPHVLMKTHFTLF